MPKEEVVLYEEGYGCPKCRTGKLQSTGGTFEWICIGGCGGKTEKKCPCYFEKDLCRGCPYFKLCSHRPSASKKGMDARPE